MWESHCNGTRAAKQRQKMKLPAQIRPRLVQHIIRPPANHLYIPSHEADPLLSIALGEPCEQATFQHTASCDYQHAADGYVLFGGEPVSSATCTGYLSAPQPAHCNTVPVPGSASPFHGVYSDSIHDYSSAHPSTQVWMDSQYSDPSYTWGIFDGRFPTNRHQGDAHHMSHGVHTQPTAPQVLSYFRAGVRCLSSTSWRSVSVVCHWLLHLHCVLSCCCAWHWLGVSLLQLHARSASPP